MIRKFLSMALIAIMAVSVASCAGEEEKKCNEIAQSMEQGDYAKAATLSNELFANRDKCSIKTLSDLTTAYITLVGVNTSKGNLDEAITAMRRTVDCYDTAMAKDSVAANKRWVEIANEVKEAGLGSISPAEIANAFRKQLAAFDSNPIIEAADSIKNNEQLKKEEVEAVAVEGVAED